jgi:hypothetical protein
VPGIQKKDEIKMKTRCVLSIAALSLATTVASAGLVQPAPVTIDLAARVASGDMRSARISPNKFAYIGCGVRYFAAGGSYMFCQAGLTQDATQQITCFSDSPALLEAVKSISDYSYIVFRWDVNGNCTSIGNSTQSFYAPLF